MDGLKVGSPANFVKNVPRTVRFKSKAGLTGNVGAALVSACPTSRQPEKTLYFSPRSHTANERTFLKAYVMSP